MNFQRGLQIYKRKNKETDALKFIVKHIVKCFEDNPMESAKIAGLRSIFDTYASVFSKVVLPTELAARLEHVVDALLSNDMVDEVLKLTSGAYPAALRVPFLELRMRAFHVLGNIEEFWKVARNWEVNEVFAYAETAYFYGTRLMDSGDFHDLHKSINSFTVGVPMAETNEKREKMQNMLLEAVKRLKITKEHALEGTVTNPEENAAQDEAQEAERHGNMKLN